MEGVQDEDGKVEERSVTLCRAGGGGGGGWDGGQLLNGSSNAETQQKPENIELPAQHFLYWQMGDALSRKATGSLSISK